MYLFRCMLPGLVMAVVAIVLVGATASPSTGPGEASFLARTDAAMARMFESFLFNFITRECPQWFVVREDIKWNALSETDPELRYLPRMRTDISARRLIECRTALYLPFTSEPCKSSTGSNRMLRPSTKADRAWHVATVTRRTYLRGRHMSKADVGCGSARETARPKVFKSCVRSFIKEDFAVGTPM